LSREMCFCGLRKPISTGQVRAVMAQTVRGSDFVVGPSYTGMFLGLLVVAMKGIVAIDPLVVTVGSRSHEFTELNQKAP
jgi:hypothetical protein